jgi:DNA polymerase-4
MDAFYASVELLRYPQLKGLPVVIGGGRRREDNLLERLQAADPEGDWTLDNFNTRLQEIPVDFFPRLSGYTGRGVITTATYAARQFGVGSAMGVMKAAKLCPDAILLPVDFDQYRHYSQRFKHIITEIAPVMEPGCGRGLHRLHPRAGWATRRGARAGAFDSESHL